MNDVIGFFGFDIDGDIKLANVDDSYENFAPSYIDWVRESNQEDILRLVTALQVVPIEADDNEIAQAFGYEDAEDFSVKVGVLPEGMLEDALGSPANMIYNGVVYGTVKPSDFKTAEYGYIINLERGTLDCYIGHQLAPHEEGVFFAVEPFKNNDQTSYGPRLYASYEWEHLPTKADFLNNHYRALMIQDEINQGAIKRAKESKLKNAFAKSMMGRFSFEKTCGKIVKSTGMPCVLRASHLGRCRSRLPLSKSPS